TLRAHDAIFIGQWSELKIDTLVQVLECFYWASGLRINMCKSKIMGVNVEDGKIQNAASKLGCLVLKTPFTYLGTKVGENMSIKEAWKEVVDRVLSRLSKWKTKTLSIGVDFLTVKIIKVKWDNVLTLRDKGGLGVASSYALNRGLMFKWIWRFYSQKSSLWTRVIKAIYGDDGKLDKDVIVEGQTCWTSIVKEARYLKGTSINVVDLIRLKLGNGDSSSFWEDKWYAGGVIKELFPRLYALELHKHATVHMKLMAPSFDNSFRRRVRSGAEESQFNYLLEIVQVINLVLRRQGVGISTRWVKSVPICKGGVETTSHLFLQCVLSKQILRKVSLWWNVNYTDVSSYEEWRAWLVSIRIPNKLKSMMEGVFYGLWWSIWNFRNKLLFDNKTPKKALIFDNLVSLSFNWCKYRCKASFKWDDWLKNPYLISV
nr:RNA-directed DNA polymerase, eukaryota, reverse transcriptase zinc-binding domain protein [Tanacetum cinerariifolium]